MSLPIIKQSHIQEGLFANPSHEVLEYVLEGISFLPATEGRNAYFSCLKVNQAWSSATLDFLSRLNKATLLRICPHVRIIDAELIREKIFYEGNEYFSRIQSSGDNLKLIAYYQFLNGLKEEPNINSLKVLKCYVKYRPKIRKGAGFTLVTIPKGTCLPQLWDLARGVGLFLISPEWSKNWKDDPFESTERYLFTGNTIEGSEKFPFKETSASLLEWEVPCLVASLTALTTFFTLAWGINPGKPCLSRNPCRTSTALPVSYHTGDMPEGSYILGELTTFVWWAPEKHNYELLTQLESKEFPVTQAPVFGMWKC